MKHKEEIKKILNLYMSKYYDEADDQQTWFGKMKLFISVVFKSNRTSQRYNQSKSIATLFYLKADYMVTVRV